MASICIGIAAIVVVLGLSYALRSSLVNTFQHLGSRTIIIRGNPSYDDIRLGAAEGLSIDDYKALILKLREVHAIALKARYGGWQTEVSLDTHQSKTVLYGGTFTLAETDDVDMKDGRFLSLPDELNRTPVCVLGQSVADHLSPGRSVIGAYLRVGKLWCRAVGVMKRSGAALGFDYDNEVIAPLSVVQSLVDATNQLDLEIHILFPATAADDQAAAEIRLAIEQYRAAEGRDATPFIVVTGEALGAYLDNTLKPIRLGLLALVSITFFIGGLGILSVMLATVRARAVEIGLRRAIGASRYAIFSHFAIEATAVSVVGGIIGTILGGGLLLVLSMFTTFFGSFVFPLLPVAISIAISIIGGFVFGTWPALVAARLNPADALRKR